MGVAGGAVNAAGDAADGSPSSPVKHGQDTGGSA